MSAWGEVCVYVRASTHTLKLFTSKTLRKAAAKQLTRVALTLRVTPIKIIQYVGRATVCGPKKKDHVK